VLAWRQRVPAAALVPVLWPVLALLMLVVCWQCMVRALAIRAWQKRQFPPAFLLLRFDGISCPARV
jgi:ABC-type dipeptide/oligopeptide/nickel transport system permease subunit